MATRRILPRPEAHVVDRRRTPPWNGLVGLAPRPVPVRTSIGWGAQAGPVSDAPHLAQKSRQIHRCSITCRLTTASIRSNGSAARLAVRGAVGRWRLWRSRPRRSRRRRPARRPHAGSAPCTLTRTGFEHAGAGAPRSQPAVDHFVPGEPVSLARYPRHGRVHRSAAVLGSHRSGYGRSLGRSPSPECAFEAW